jgi:hypothetical protein
MFERAKRVHALDSAAALNGAVGNCSIELRKSAVEGD